MPKDPELLAHLEWLGYLQPVGLVVSAPALAAAGAHVNKNIVPEHRRFLEWVKEVKIDEVAEPVPAVIDLAGVLQNFMGWEASDLVGASDQNPLPADLEVTLTDYNETLRPTYAVKEVESGTPVADAPGSPKWLMLIQTEAAGLDLDEATERDGRHWQASAQARFERLLRETRVPIGLLFNGSVTEVHDQVARPRFPNGDSINQANRGIPTVIHDAFSLHPAAIAQALETRSRKAC